MLGIELWDCKFDGLLSLVKEYIVDLWEIQNKSYMIVTQDSIYIQLHFQSSPGERNSKFNQNDRFCQNGNVHLS